MDYDDWAILKNAAVNMRGYNVITHRWDGTKWVLVETPEYAGDPDGLLVPLPERRAPERVVPLFPLAAYEALTRWTL